MPRFRALTLLSALAALIPAAGAQEVLLVPRYGTTALPAAIAAFSPVDGSVINETFIAADGRLRQPVNAIPSGKGTILVSDTLADSIFEYDMEGNFLRTFTDIASSGLDAPKGIDIRNGVVYAVVTAGAFANTIQRYDVNTGASLGTWAPGTGNSQDIHFRGGDALVSDFTTDDIHRYDLNGAPMGNLITSSAATGTLTNPYQIQSQAGGNLLIGSFANNPGALYEYDAAGNPLMAYGTGFVRGGYRLDNGNILYSQNNAMTLVDAGTLGTTNLLTYGNWQYIERVNLTATAIPEPGSLALLGMGVAALAARRRKS